MLKISNIEILSLGKQKVLSVRNYTNAANLTLLIEDSFSKLSDYLI